MSIYSDSAFIILSHVYTAVPHLEGLTERQLVDMRTALRSELRRRNAADTVVIADASKLSPEMLNDGLRMIEGRLDQMLEGTKTDGAYSSRIRAAVRAAGFPIKDAHGRSALLTDWQLELDRDPDPPGEMHTFAAVMTDLGIDPIDVTNETLDRYLAQLITSRPEHSARQSVRRVVAWLRCHGLGGESGKHFRVPGARDRRRMRPDLPKQFIADTQAWARYREVPPLSDLAIKRGIGQRRAEDEAKLLRLAASHHLDRLGVASTQCPALLGLLMEPVLRPTIEAMAQASKSADPSDGWGAMAYDAARLAARIRRSAFPVALGAQAATKAEIEALEELAANHSPKGTNEFNRTLRDKLRRFTTWSSAKKLLDLPRTLVENISDIVNASVREQRTLSVAFSVQLTREAPELTHKLATIRLDTITDTGTGDERRVTVIWPRQARSMPPVADVDLSPDGIALYDRYCRYARDRHPHAVQPWLFLGRDGTSMCPQWFRCRLVKITQEHLGVGLSVRDLRWAYAMIALAMNPRDRDLAAGYLGHKNKQTTDRLVALVEDWRRSGAFSDFPKIGGE